MDALGGATGRTLVVAHRGLHDNASGSYENSLGAFGAGIAAGVDILELDVHRTRDGVLVVHHDAELRDGRKIADLDYAQLPALPDGQPVPRLQEVADLARGTHVKLAVELKEEGYERDVVLQLTTSIPKDQLELISFSRKSIAAVEQLDPSLRTGLLEPHLPKWLRDSPFYGLSVKVMDLLHWHPSLRAAAKVGADYVSVEQRMATDSFLRAAKERGTDVDVWTVDSDAGISRLLDTGLVTGIVTDRPQRAMELRDERQALTGQRLLAA